MSITRQLAEFAATIDYDSLPAEVTQRAKLLIMDTLGIALRARHEAVSTPCLLATVDRLGLNHGKSGVIGVGNHYSAPAAAWLNGAFAHSLDFDDTHARGSIHPSAPIVPAALAAAEMTGKSGKEVVAAIIAGYEVQIRLSLALVPKDHYDRGYHPTATCGAFGAAAAASRVLGLTTEQTANAIGASLSQTAGTLEFLADGSWNKLFQVGYAALNGVVAASLAAEGFNGAKQAIEGDKGFLNAYSPNPIPEKAVDALGEVYETLNIAVKPYPSCRYSHAALDAVLDLKAANNLTEDDIDSIEIGLPQTGWNIIGNPETDKHNPQSVVDGQFSMPFVAAIALREGRMTWDDYQPHLQDDKTLDLCKRINTIVDAKAEAEFPVNMSGIVRVRTRANDELENFVVVPKGEPDNFLTSTELRAKFDSLVGPYLSQTQHNALAEQLLNLEQCQNISELLSLSYPQQTARQQAEKIAAVGDD